MKIFFKYIFYTILIYIFLNIFFDIYQIITFKNLSENLNQYVRILQNYIFISSLIYINNKSLKCFIYSIPISYFEVEYSLFNNYIFPIFKYENNISPEYARIIFFLIILFFYFYKCIKNKKIIDIFLTISMTAIFLTAILFHSITLKQLNYYTENQKNEWLKYYQYNNVELLCKIENLECKNINKNNKKYIFNIYEHLKPYMDNNKNYFYYMIANDSNINNRILSRKPIAFIKYKNDNYIIIDNNNYTKYLKFNEKIFGILGIISHIIWIFGIIYLIKFHQKKLSKS